jgi:hypothetical protein
MIDEVELRIIYLISSHSLSQLTSRAAVCYSGLRHLRRYLLPVTRFQRDELADAISEMELILEDTTQKSVVFSTWILK